MKRIVLLVIPLLVLLFGISAAFGAGISAFGIKAGFNFSKMPNDFYNSHSEFRFDGGIFVRFKPIQSINLSVQPEIKYTRIGDNLGEFTRYSETHVIIGTYKFYYHHDYIEMPVLARFGLIPEGIIKPDILLGFSTSYLVRAKGGDTFKEFPDYDVKEYLNEIDCGFLFGLGFDIFPSQYMVTLEARYYLGLTDINNNAVYSRKNRVLSFSIGFGVNNQ